MANEKRLIDANAFEEKLKKFIGGTAIGFVLVGALRNEPTVDAVEVVHGEWVNIIHAVVDTTGYCTRCDKQAVWRTRNKPYAYCPNCGAKMRGSEE